MKLTEKEVQVENSFHQLAPTPNHDRLSRVFGVFFELQKIQEEKAQFEQSIKTVDKQQDKERKKI